MVLIKQNCFWLHELIGKINKPTSKNIITVKMLQEKKQGYGLNCASRKCWNENPCSGLVWKLDRSRCSQWRGVHAGGGWALTPTWPVLLGEKDAGEGPVKPEIHSEKQDRSRGWTYALMRRGKPGSLEEGSSSPADFLIFERHSPEPQESKFLLSLSPSTLLQSPWETNTA